MPAGASYTEWLCLDSADTPLSCLTSGFVFLSVAWFWLSGEERHRPANLLLWLSATFEWIGREISHSCNCTRHGIKSGHLRWKKYIWEFSIKVGGNCSKSSHYMNDYMNYYINDVLLHFEWNATHWLRLASWQTSEESFHSQDKRDNQLKKQKLKAAAWGKFTCRRSRDSKAIIGFTSWVIWWWLITPCMRHTSSLGIFQCLILAKKRND